MFSSEEGSGAVEGPPTSNNGLWFAILLWHEVWHKNEFLRNTQIMRDISQLMMSDE